MSSLKRVFLQKKMPTFLKNEYGWGGSYPVIIGAGIDESHDGKGITISKGIGNEEPHITTLVVAGGEAYRGTYPNGQILKSKGKRTLSSVA